MQVEEGDTELMCSGYGLGIKSEAIGARCTTNEDCYSACCSEEFKKCISSRESSLC